MKKVINLNKRIIHVKNEYCLLRTGEHTYRYLGAQISPDSGVK